MKMSARDARPPESSRFIVNYCVPTPSNSTAAACLLLKCILGFVPIQGWKAGGRVNESSKEGE